MTNTTESARCRNCGQERPLDELQKVGSGRHRRWTGLWSCKKRSRCRKAQQALNQSVNARLTRLQEAEDKELRGGS